ncbi:MAG: RNA methyltransferase [Hyphomicrobiales bacterium]
MAHPWAYKRCRPEQRRSGVRGYFGIGVERISKPMNLGNLMRSAHAFGASFVFTVDAYYKVRDAKSDTSRAPEQVPYYAWDKLDDMALPKGCRLVGVELMDEAVDLPSFRHPAQAAYVLGPERGSLSPELIERCDLLLKIPTAFCINVATAGAIVMYDRVKMLGRFPAPPVTPGGPVDPAPTQKFGSPVLRRNKPPKS